MVYKLVSRADSDGTMRSVAKASTAKTSVGGRKTAARRLGEHVRAAEEQVIIGSAEQIAAWRPDPDQRPLHVPLVSDGVVNPAWIGPDGVRTAATHHDRARAELPRGARRLSVGDPALPTTTLYLPE
jgi:nicotinate phosphoribosyltransferase